MTSTKTVILVEDNEAERIIMAAAIRQRFGESVKLEMYTNFWRVVQRAKKSPDPALILVDVQLISEENGEPVLLDGRELVETLTADEDVLADVRILTGQTRHPEDLDKNKMGEVLEVIRRSIEPKKANPESNLRIIERQGRKIAYGEELTRREIDVAKTERKSLRDDMSTLTVAVEGNTEAMGELTEAYRNRKPVVHPAAQLGLVTLAIVTVIAATIMFLGRNMDVQSLESDYKNWRIGVNSEVDDVRSAVDSLEWELDTARSSDHESDGTDFDNDTLETPQP